MSRNVTAWTMAVLLAGLACEATADGPPPLAPPALTAPSVAAPSDPPKPPAAAAPAPAGIPESRPVLVVPGVTAPRRSHARPPATTPLAPDLGAPRELPDLEIPKEMLEPAPREIPRVASPTDRPPTVVESAPRATSPASPAGPRRPGTAPRPTPERTPATRPSSAPESARRPAGLFGRFFPAPVPGGRNSPEDRSSVTVEPRSDPAADAALQRRIERQLRESVGDRVRAYEVRVVDRNVTVRVRVSRFWQKRSVRHAVESLPALSGYRARVEVLD